MYRVVFDENVLLHGQNGKKPKVFGIFKNDLVGCFWDSHKESNYWTNFAFL